jgi:hypothetical protein
MKALESLANNLVNGNLSDARNQAKRFNYMKIIDFLQEYLGYSADKAHKAACYLKSGNNYQAYCDAE